MAFKLFSPVFKNQSNMPVKYTCEGENISPPLKWTGLPQGTKSLALVVEDPDAPDPIAPKRVWNHWIIYNIPPELSGVEEDYADLPLQSLQGLNSWDKIGYGGPCPPVGRHRYFFKLYALDKVLDNLQKPGKIKLEKTMQGHVLGVATLIGLYQKQKAA